MKRHLINTLLLNISVITVFLYAKPLSGSAAVQAAPTSDMTDITSDLTHKVSGKVQWPIGHVSANYVRNGHVTQKTTNVKVDINGTIISPESSNLYHLWILALKGDSGATENGALSLGVDPEQTKWNVNKTYTMNTHGIVAGTNFYIGNKTQLANKTIYETRQYYQVVSQVTLKPTMESDLTASDSKITGTGTQVGDTITVKMGSTSKTTTVDSDGNWSLDWGSKLTAGATVTATESNDYGDNPGTTTTKVASRTLHMLLTSSNSVSITAGGSIEIDGLVASDGNDNLSNKDVTVHAALSNGNKIDDFTLNGDDSGFFYLKLLGSQLDVGKNIVTLYATDKDGDKSNSVTVNVNVTGNVSLTSVSKSVSFTITEIPTSETLVKMADNLDVEVQDDRAAGKSWAVYATASSMKSSKHVLKGNTVYVDSSGAKHIMTNQSTLVGSGKSTGSATTTNLSKNWTGTSGIFLDVQPGIYAGSYTGTIDWSLQDTPKN